MMDPWVAEDPALERHAIVIFARRVWCYPGPVVAYLRRRRVGTRRAVEQGMLTLFSALVHFIVTASDPSWSCKLTHRDPDLAGTYYLYCSKMSPDGVELIQVGRFISDTKAAELAKEAP